MPELGYDILPPEDPGYTYGDVLPFRRSNAPGSPLEWAWPTMARNAINDLALTAKAPGEALLGRISPEQMPAIAATMGQTLAGVGLGVPKPSASLGIFGGTKMMATPEMVDSLAMARKMQAVGTHPIDIVKKTGWFQEFPTGDWKREIQDWISSSAPGAELLPESHGGFTRYPNWQTAVDEVKVPPSADGMKVGDVLGHPELFRAYPWIQDIKIGNNTGGSYGNWDVTRNQINIKSGMPEEETMNTLLHEIQHAVQFHENFAYGGAPQEFLPPDFALVKRGNAAGLERSRADADSHGFDWFSIERGLQVELGDKSKSFDTPESLAAHKADLESYRSKEPDAVDLYKARVKLAQRAYQMERLAGQRYWNLAGEVEARNVEARRAQMTPTRTLPSTTEGYPWEQQEYLRPDQRPTTIPYNFKPVDYDPWQK